MVSDTESHVRLRDLRTAFRQVVLAGVEGGKSDFETLPEVLIAVGPYADHFPELEEMSGVTFPTFISNSKKRCSSNEDLGNVPLVHPLCILQVTRLTLNVRRTLQAAGVPFLEFVHGDGLF